MTVKSILKKTFGGLSREYYFRQFVFGLIFPVLLFFAESGSDSPRNFDIINHLFLYIVNPLLYPYARFVYESIAGFIMGETIIFGNAIFMLGWKFITMLICWMAAFFIAPVGLAYLFYYHHIKNKPQG